MERRSHSKHNMRRITAFLLAIVLLVSSVWFDIPDKAMTALAETTAGDTTDTKNNELESTKENAAESTAAAKSTEEKSAENTSQESSEASSTEENSKDESSEEKFAEENSDENTSEETVEDGSSAEDSTEEKSSEESSASKEQQTITIASVGENSDKVSIENGELTLIDVVYGDSVQLQIQSSADAGVNLKAYKKINGTEESVGDTVLKIENVTFAARAVNSTTFKLTFNKVVDYDIFLKATVSGDNTYEKASQEIKLPKNSVQKKALTVQGLDSIAVAESKVYDGTTVADIEEMTKATLNESEILNQDDVSLEQSAAVADKNVGENKPVTITFSLKGNDKDNYKLTTETYTDDRLKTTIIEKELTIDTSKISISKIYDGTTDILKEHVTIEEGILLGIADSDKDAIKLTRDSIKSISLIQGDENVGEDKEVEIEFDNQFTNYSLSNNGKITKDDFKVIARPVNVTIEDISIVYNAKDIKEKIKEAIQVEDAEPQQEGQEVTESGYLSDDSEIVDVIKEAIINNINLEQYPFEPGEYNINFSIDSIQKNIEDNNYKNYELNITPKTNETQAKIILKVSEGQSADNLGNEISNILNLSNQVCNQNNYYFQKGENYSININESYNKLYDKIYISNEESELKEEWILNTESEGKNTVYLALVKVNDKEEPVAWTNSFEFTYIVDGKAPGVEFLKTTEEAYIIISGQVVKLEDVVPFNEIQFTNNNEISTTIKVSDLDIKDAIDTVNGSGVKLVEYAWINYNENSDLETLIKNNTDKFKKLTINPETDTFKLPQLEGNYILVVKTEDNVGNIQYVCSNGVIFETKKPEIIKIALNDEDITQKLDECKYYGKTTESIKLEVKAKEITTNNDIISGISSISYALIKDGNLIKKSDDVNYTDITVNDNKPVTLADAAQEFVASFDELPIKNTEEGTYELRIAATDYAGNSNEKIVSFIVKRTLPKVTLKLDTDAENCVKSEERYYYSKEAVVTATIEEKFLETDSIKVKINGTEYLYQEGENGESGQLLGRDIKDVIGELTVGANSDVHTLKLTFSGEDSKEIDYNEVQVICQDKSGNVSNSEKEDAGTLSEQFSVDKLMPEVTLALDTDAEDCVKSGERYYYPKEAVVTATIKEKFLETDSIKVKINGTEYLYQEGENGESGQLLGRDIKDVIGELTVDANSTVHILTLTFSGEDSKEIDYNEVQVICQDKSGNVSNSEKEDAGTLSEQFSVDKLMPEVTLKLNTEDKEPSEGRYHYSSEAEIIATITERFLDKSSIKVNINSVEYSYQNGEILDQNRKALDNVTGELVPDSENSNTHRLTLTFSGEDSKEIDYNEVQVICQDKSGNVSNSEKEDTGTLSESEKFSIDKLAPKITAAVEYSPSQLKDNVAYYSYLEESDTEKSKVIINVTFTERFLNFDTILFKIKKEGTEYLCKVETTNNEFKLKDEEGSEISALKNIQCKWTSMYNDSNSSNENSEEDKNDNTKYQSNLMLIFNQDDGYSVQYDGLEVTCEDYAGNTSEPNPCNEISIKNQDMAKSIVIDNLAPVITADASKPVQIKNRADTEASTNLDDYQSTDKYLYYNEDAKVTVTFQERYLDKDKIKLCFIDENKKEKELSLNGFKEDKDGNYRNTEYNISYVWGESKSDKDDSTNTLIFKFESIEGKSTVYRNIIITGADMANNSGTTKGNSTVDGVEGGLNIVVEDGYKAIVDKVKPKITISLSKPEFSDTQLAYYKDKAVLTGTIQERYLEVGTIRVSINGTDYFIGNNDNKLYADDVQKQELENVDFEWTQPYTGEPLEKADETSSNLTDDTETIFKITFRGDPNNKQSLDYRDISVSCYDAALNQSSCSWDNETSVHDFTVDHVAPQIDITRSKESGHQKYYANQAVVTAKITERFIDESTLRVNVRRDNESGSKAYTLKELEELDGGNIVINWTPKEDIEGNSNKDATVSTLKLTFKGTKNTSIDYNVVSVTIADKAANAKTSDELSFVVDQKEPVITQTITEASKNTKYYNAKTNAVVTVSIQERYLDTDALRMHIKLNGTENAYALTDTLPNGVKLTKKQISANTKGDETVSTLKIQFPKDGDYEFYVTCNDKAFNNAAYTMKSKKELAYVEKATNATKNITSFIVDKTAPSIAIAFSDANSSAKPAKIKRGGSRIYDSTKSITAAITVKERNFAANNKDIQAAFTMTNSSGNAVSGSDKTIAGYTARLQRAKTSKNKTGWSMTRKDSHEDSVNTNTLTFTPQANYTWTSFSIEDMAGNKTTYVKSGKTYQFTIDRSVPVGKISVTNMNSTGGYGNPASKIWDNYKKKPVWYEWFSRNSVRYDKKDVYDETANIKSIMYYVDYSRTRGLDPKTITSWKNWKSNMTLTMNRQAVIYMRLEDKAENVSYYNTDSLIADNRGGTISFKLPQDPGNGIYNADVNVQVSLQDSQASDGSYAGLHSVEWRVYEDGSATQSGGKNYTAKEHKLSDTIIVPIKAGNGANENNSNNISLQVTLTDNSGNKVTKDLKDIKIDVDAPEVEITYENSNAQNQKYYKDTRTAIVTVRERNFDEQNVHFTALKSSNYSVGGWSHSGETHVARVTFDKDGDYQFDFNCTDLATNDSDTKRSEEFTIDKTLPKIQVTYDKNQTGRDNQYYVDSRRANITLTEHNFSASDVTVTITRKKDGESAQTVTYNGGWTNSGDSHFGSYDFDEEAVYTFTLTCKDLAGNVSENYAVDTFTVDKTDPTVVISNVENRHGYIDKVEPKITCEDINYNADGLNITLSYRPYSAENLNTPFVSYDKTVKTYTRQNLTNGHGQTCSYANIAKDIKYDGYYKLTAQATDKAGRKSKVETVEFTVNRFGSYYELGDESTKNLIEAKYHTSPQDIVITEINVDEVKGRQISYTLNGQTVQLEEGKDYRADLVNSKVGEWKKYQYVIYKENFEKQGTYVLTLYSENQYKTTGSDKNESVKVTNTNTNTAKNKAGVEKSQQLVFVIDNEIPQGSIIGLESGQRYSQDSKEFTIRCKDNNEYIKELKVLVNGVEMATYSAQQMLDSHNEIVYNLQASSDWQKVSFRVWDYAGGMYESPEVDVLVTTNKWVQFKNIKPLFYGTWIILGLAVLGILLLLWKRNKKEEEESQQTE